MAMKRSNHALLLLLLLMFITLTGHKMQQVLAQSTCPSNTQQTLNPCATDLTGANGDPSTQCCDAISSVDPTCLCEVMASASLSAADLAKAMQMPTKCGLAAITC
ncbi:hypothetical protein O6H91_01G086300 [Diphasiastrum complanatum]|uniref:Uncharacterized protein n=1 Tax=Diphasiastrum complanatum TaxID=34168 RepID=A0ACC2ESY2_DIPCM|nr:hypothetical protein O6H91_01G086300 [Diphasiastrum complanatum]